MVAQNEDQGPAPQPVVPVVRYIRAGPDDRTPIGALAAVGPGKVGWSVCHPNDTFVKARARAIAIGRAIKGTNKPVPRRIAKAFEEMVERSYRYFDGQYFDGQPAPEPAAQAR